MDDTKTAETCDKCEKPFEILITDFERAMKDELPVLCPDCQDMLLAQQMDNPPGVAFKYEVCGVKGTNFDVLGTEGWELIAVDNGQAFFKKEYFKES